LQARSANGSLLKAAARAAPEDVEVVLFDGLRRLPLFDPDLLVKGEPEAVRDWRNAIAGSHALLIASPEYGHSLPGALKNAIDWVIGSGELERKVIAITAAVPGPERGGLGLKALRDTLQAVSAIIVGGEPIVRGAAFDTDAAKLLHDLIERVRAESRSSST
jgi:NAD(P)H-dependent FMN reductase